MKIIIALIIIIIALLCVVFHLSNKPVSIENDYTSLDTSGYPIQFSDISEESITFASNNLNLEFSPIAKYTITAKVVSKKKYSKGWDAKISPYDLALAWGNLAELHNKKYIKYNQILRFYFYEYSAECPFDKIYISAHSSNNHIIPANKNIYKAIKIIKKNYLIKLEGFLINIKGKYKGGIVSWNSSLTRTDTGDGACELLYVKEVRVGSKIYR